MPDLAIGRTTARRFILGRQGLWPGRRWQGLAGAAQALRAIEAAQVDPLVVIARNHDLILHSRVIDYQAEYLDQLLYRDRLFFDYGGAIFIYPMDELPYWRIAMQRKRQEPHFNLVRLNTPRVARYSNGYSPPATPANEPGSMSRHRKVWAATPFQGASSDR